MILYATLPGRLYPKKLLFSFLFLLREKFPLGRDRRPLTVL